MATVIPIIEVQGKNLFEVPQFISFQQTSSINQFSDSFTLTLGDPDNSLLWDVVDCEKVVTTHIESIVNKFRISSLRVSLNPIQLVVQGVSLESESSLDEPEPKHYTNTTDNQIIKEMFPNYTLILDNPINLKEYDVSIGSTRAEVATDVANQNGFYLYANGSKIFKTKIAESENDPNGTAIFNEDQLNNVQLLKDTSKARTKLIGYSTDRKLSKIRHTEDVQCSSIFTGTLDINRTMRVSVNGDDIGEVKRFMQANKFKAQPVETVTVEIKGRYDVALNTVVRFQHSKLKVNILMVVNEKTFSISKDSLSTTLTLSGLGRKIQ